MKEKMDGLFFVKNYEEMRSMLERLLGVAYGKGVFGEPLKVGDYTTITVSEVSVSLGYGMGGGGGSMALPAAPADEPSAELEATEQPAAPGEGYGAGGGGGGFAAGRPVAIISIGPDGVDVEPVVDVTKVVLAFFTAMGTMFLMFGQMRRK